MTDATAAVSHLSWAQVCARRLERHGLATPSPDARPADIVRAMGGAAHAQVMSAVELSIGLRTAGLTRAGVRHALWAERSLVKAFGPRGTVHLLPTQDLPMWVGALSAAPPPAHNLPEKVRLTPDQTEAVVAAIAVAVEDAELTIDELTDAVVEHAGSWAGDLVMPAFQGLWPRWRQALHLAGIRGVLCFGPNQGRKVTYTSPRRWLPGFQPADHPTALAGVVKRYLHAFGPATPQQFAHWLAVPPRWAVALFDSLAGELEPVEVDGTRAWVTAGDTAAPPTRPRGVRLLPYFDAYAYLVGNQPRELLYPGRAAKRAAGNFQVLLIDGVVAGVWQQRRSGRKLDITVEPLVPLTLAQRRELDEQVERVGAILEGTPRLAIGTVTVGSHA
jgi:Winged helix DNA-binding domain